MSVLVWTRLRRANRDTPQLACSSLWPLWRETRKGGKWRKKINRIIRKRRTFEHRLMREGSVWSEVLDRVAAKRSEMKDWDLSVPYLLPRILSFKKRNNTLPAKLPKQPNLRSSTLGNVNARWSAWRRSDYFYPEMIPEPDYSDTESEGGESSDRSEEASERLRDLRVNDHNKRRHMPPVANMGEYNNGKKNETQRPKKIQFSEDELIKPKKPANPYLESTERQKLHKELKFNQKYGSQTGRGQKRSELEVALEKYTEGKIRRDLQASRRSSLERVLEQQARKIEMHEREGTTEVRPAWIEQLQRQHFTKRADPKTDEFYRVHARVVSNIMNLESNNEDQTSTDMSSGRSSSPSEHSD